jgi:hypothetical protein
LGRQIALVLALLAGALIAWTQLRLPAPAPADAPQSNFSATRALDDVRLVAAVPHPMGSAANHAVREALRARLDDLGLSPRLRRDDVVARQAAGELDGGSAETLIGVLPGRDRSLPPLALMAHYDSVPGAPGAADNAAGVATALEIVRAIEARGAPARDVVVILTDGEEEGLLGARGVFAHDPLAQRLGFVINFDARGSGGRALMFETGRQDRAAVEVFRRTAVRPVAGSLFGEVYARLPNDTDFSIARQAGKAGLNWAFAGRAFDYHSPTDTIANLQPGTLQDLGDQATAAATAVAFASQPPPARADVVYGVLFGRAVLAYPPDWGWLVLLLAAALLGIGLMRARQLAPLPWSEVARGAGAGLYTLTCAAVVLHLAGVVATAGTGALGPLRLLAAADRWEAALLLLALGVLLFAAAQAARERRVAIVVLPLLAGLASCAITQSLDPAALGLGLGSAALGLAIGGHPISRPAGWAGVLLLGLAAATAAQVAAPLAAYVLAWPLLLGALAAAVSALTAERSLGTRIARAILAAVALGWAGVLAHLVVVVAGLPELLVLPLFVAALTMWPLAQPTPAPSAWSQAPGRLLLLAGAALTLLVRFSSPWDARHPQPTFVAYQLDQDVRSAWRVARPELRTPWSDAVLTTEGGQIETFRHWAWPEPMAAAPARPAALPPPAIAVSREPLGLVVLKVTPPPGARALTLELSPEAPARLVAAGAATADLPLSPGGWTRVVWTAPNADGLSLTIRPGAPGRVRLRNAAAFDRWPAGVASPAPPPPDVSPRGRSGEALATGSRTLAW